MTIRKGVATWLELAVAPDWRRESAEILVHSVSRCNRDCRALTMDGRWLCNNDGRLTVFEGEGAVARFLDLVRIRNFRASTDVPQPIEGRDEWYCLGMCSRGLSPCRKQPATLKVSDVFAPG